MKIEKISSVKEDIDKIVEVSESLRQGNLVIFPTETVYGLGANADNPEAVLRLYDIKKRPKDKPLSLHIANADFLLNYLDKIPSKFQKLADKFWPGPLTVVLDTKDGKKGFRMPDNDVALKLIELSNVPVVAPSANLSGKSPPIKVEQLDSRIKEKVDVIIDNGPTDIRIESTVVDISGDSFSILRRGAINKEQIKAVI